MTLSYSQAKVLYAGNGQTTKWDIPFAFLNAADLQITKINAKGESEALQNDFSIDLQEHAVFYPMTGSQTPPLAQGEKLLICRHTPLTQQTDFQAQQSFDPFVLEEGYDKAMMIAQEQAEMLARTVKFPAHESPSSTDAAAYLQHLQESLQQAQQTGQIAQETLLAARQANQTAVETTDRAEEAVSMLEGYVQDAENARQLAKKWAVQTDAEVVSGEGYGAKYYALNAQESASSIASAAAAAEAKASAAANSASAAADAASAADTAVNLAQNWAVKTDGAVSGGEYSAKYHAQQAAGSAAAALTSQQAAASFSSAAAAAKTGAENAQSAAESAQALAAQANTSAQTAQSQAAGSAEASAASAAAAGTSALAAQEWAVKTDGAVAGGEYSAKYHAQQAATSASSASAAQTAAAAAQTAAESAKTAAQSAQTAAESAKTQAADSATSAFQSAIDAANSAASAKGLQIGAIYFSQSALATDNPGALPLWTGEYYVNASVLYPDFYNWVKSHTELCKTKQQYDAAVSSYGECPYYVVDEVAGSLRLPRLANYLKMAGAEGITQQRAGLPNITASPFMGETDYQHLPEPKGAVYKANGGNSYAGASDSNNDYYKFDASLCSQVYGQSDTVTPAHTTLYPWVYAFNSAVAASVAQAAGFTEALSGKANADLSNLPATYDYVAESYTDASGNWYEVWKSGKIRQGGMYDCGSSMRTDSVTISMLKPFANINYTAVGTPSRGATVNTSTSIMSGTHSKTTTSFAFTFYGLQGADTVQYINWIAEGQGA